MEIASTFDHRSHPVLCSSLLFTALMAGGCGSGGDEPASLNDFVAAVATSTKDSFASLQGDLTLSGTMIVSASDQGAMLDLPSAAVSNAAAVDALTAQTKSINSIGDIVAVAPVAATLEQNVQTDASGNAGLNASADTSAPINAPEATTPISSIQAVAIASVAQTTAAVELPTKFALAATPSTVVQVVRMSDTSSIAGAVPVPNLSALKVFEARPPYFVETKDGPKRVKLGIYGTGDDIRRSFDFVQPIINSLTNRTNALTLQMPVLTASGINFINVSDGSTQSQ